MILPGFQRGKQEKKSLSPEDMYDWEKFKQLHNKWHKKLAVVRAQL
jgi:Transcription factor/nuclear export subunit protein 2